MKCFECDIPMNRKICGAVIKQDGSGCGIHTCPKCGKVVHSKRGQKILGEDP